MEKRIGTISNYYGGLCVKKDDDKYFWGIENYEETEWEEITKKMYDILLGFENKRILKLKKQDK